MQIEVMKMIIAEKAIAGRRIAAILAGKNVAQTTVKGAPAFPFERGGKEFVVVPLRGHIVDVDFPKKYSYWIGTDLRKLINAEIDYVGTEKTIIAALKDVATNIEEVIVATDADREGEAIGVEALDFVKEKNPKVKITRAYFSAITPKDITNAFDKLDKVDFNFADSANARREIDLVWGAVITRYLSIVSGRLGKEFLSAGRVQTPVLALIVDREKERLAFEKKPYWEIVALFEKDKKKFEAMHKEGRFWEKEKALAVMAKKADHATVVKVESSTRTLAKPTPFNTTAFQRSAAALGMNISEAMNIAESLYQEGYASYPRTDNCVYPPNLDLMQILNDLKNVAEFRPLVEKVLAQKKIVPSAGKESKDHPPIHPVSAAPKSKLSDREWKIYELIVRRFLATLYEDAITENKTVLLDMNGEIFVAKGQLIIKAGWKELYPYSTLNEVLLPPLKEGDIAKLLKLDMLDKETQPPARYSQAALIKLMEDLGLGTKATRHEIIKKLYSRQYISGVKSIEPNKIAFSVIDSLEKHAPHVTKPEMTSELEKEMDEIAAGKKEKAEVVDDSRKFLAELLEELMKNKDLIGSEMRKALSEDAILGKCPNCGNDLRMILSRNNKRFVGCRGYPKCTTTYPLPQKGKLVTTDKVCEFCNAPVIKIFGARYRYEMCITMNCESKKDWGKKKPTETGDEGAGESKTKVAPEAKEKSKSAGKSEAKTPKPRAKRTTKKDKALELLEKEVEPEAQEETDENGEVI